MSFENPDYLYWLAILPFLALIYIMRVRIRKGRLRQWLGSRTDFLRSSISDTGRHIKFTLGILVLALFLTSLSRPQGRGEEMEVKNSGIYILLLVDASNSMLAEDVKPNRLTFMKKEISRLIDMSSGDQIALGVFAHSSILAAPFTNDLSAIKSYLDELSTDHLSSQGTNFERAFQLSDRVFSTIKETQNERSVKAIIMASDGEDHSENTEKIIKSLIKKYGLRVFTLSFGTKGGGVIPVRDYKGQIKEYKKDIDGDLVITQLKNKSLKDFASWGKGAYYHVTYNGQAIKRLRKNLERLEKRMLDKTTWTKKKENYQWFLILALLTALIELLLTDRAFFYKKESLKDE